MLAGGLGNIREEHVEKKTIENGYKLICLGGPAMLIGLGGGAASSLQSSDDNKDLDFASVQRGNPEMERRCQEVIDRCWQMNDNPISFIHDVGAGGLSNAFPELVKDGNKGGKFNLRAINNDEAHMSPLKFGLMSRRNDMLWRLHQNTWLFLNRYVSVNVVRLP